MQVAGFRWRHDLQRGRGLAWCPGQGEQTNQVKRSKAPHCRLPGSLNVDYGGSERGEGRLDVCSISDFHTCAHTSRTTAAATMGDPLGESLLSLGGRVRRLLWLVAFPRPPHLKSLFAYTLHVPPHMETCLLCQKDEELLPVCVIYVRTRHAQPSRRF